jgi:CubicO group peptidase (beta-lactamase class C family)
MNKPLTLLLAVACILTVTTASSQPAPPVGDSADKPDPAYVVIADPKLADFDKFVADQLQRWNTPGVAITVIKDGKVILQRGYGLRNIEKNLPMTSRTVQPIASVTKSFTVSALATQVREGKLSWDKPVREYLPDFRLHSDYATLNVTPRDMLSHRTGLPRHDFSWVGTKATREELYKRLQYMEASAPLRSTWQYNNFMFMTAGYLGGRIAGSSWEELVAKNIFEPLGMRSASFTIDALKKTTDHATPYLHDENEKPTQTSHLSADAMGPTGAINAHAEDMGKYLRMLMNRGVWEGKTIINASDLVEMTNPQMVMSDNRRFEELSATQYGMGFFLTHYRGHRLIHHGGNLAGLSALLSWLPQQNVGVFVATNMSGSPLPSVFTYAIYDRLLGMPLIDWSARQWDAKERNKASEESARKQNLSPRKANTKPSHSLDDYVGEYAHPAYDRLVITRKGDTLIGTYNGITSPFPHFHYDVFEAPGDKTNYLAKTKLAFQTDIEGEIASVRWAIEPAVKPLEFVRQPDATFKDPAFLKRFEGEYELGPQRLTVRVRGDNVVTITSPGSSTQELVGLRGNRFSVKNRTGFTVEFVADKSGTVTQAAFYQPNGNFVAVKK